MGKKKRTKKAFAAVYAALCLTGNMFSAHMGVYAAESQTLTETEGADSKKAEALAPDVFLDSSMEAGARQDIFSTAGDSKVPDTALAAGHSETGMQNDPNMGNDPKDAPGQPADTTAGSEETEESKDSTTGSEETEESQDSTGSKNDAESKDSTGSKNDAESKDDTGSKNNAESKNQTASADDAEIADDTGAKNDADTIDGTDSADESEIVNNTGSDAGTAVDDDITEMDPKADTVKADTEGDAAAPVSNGSYTDAEGVEYLYHICEDGTADIYSVEEYAGKNMNIPADLDGHAVTRLSFRLRSGNIGDLVIPESVVSIGGMAFGARQIGTLHYNAASAVTADQTEPAPFSASQIGNLLLGGNVTAIPERMFARAVFLQDEVRISVQTVGREAFQSAQFQKLTVSESVQGIGDEAFAWAHIQQLCWNTADMQDTSYGNGSAGSVPFAHASIAGLSFGDAVVSIPDCFLAGAELSVSGFTLPPLLTSIGESAFSGAFADGDVLDRLVIGENMEHLGKNAFYGWNIGTLEYHAADAATDGTEGNGPFAGAQAQELHIGESVTVLPAKIFCGMGLDLDELEIAGNIVSVEDKAFCTGSDKELRIGTLTVGENVRHMGTYALAADSIGTLHYYAADASTNGNAGCPDSPFYNTYVGSLHIGETVRKIPASVFAGIALTQDVLEFPAGITSIGDKALQKSSWRDISIGTALIGENVSYIGRGVFESAALEKAVVHARKAEEAYKSMELEADGLPACTDVKIHGGSDFYDYFTKNAAPEHVTLLCSDFESSRGEEYFDAEKGCFVVPVTETCTECGYQKLGGEYADAHTVVFTDYDGTVLSRQAVHDGEDAAAPKEPQRTGWRFTGWDCEFSAVRSDLTVTAQYEILKYTVTFKDGETVLSRQEVAYGKDASAPENPSRPDEAWGKWQFTGWDGSFTGISKDETVQAVFEKVRNVYEVVFYDAAGNVFSKQTVAHGGKANLPQAPEKEADAEHVYSFTGWDGDTEKITGNAGFHPVYESKTRTYKVTFMNGDAVADLQEVAYGNSASMPPEPVKAADGKYIYNFAGWDGSFGFITEDTVIHALFDAEEIHRGDDKTDQDKDEGGSGSTDKDSDKNNGDSGSTDKDPDKNNEDSGSKDKDPDKDKGDSGSTNQGSDKDKGDSGSTDQGPDKDKGDSGSKDKDPDKNEGDSGNSTDKDKDHTGGTDKGQNKGDTGSTDKEQNKGNTGSDKEQNQGNKGDSGNHTGSGSHDSSTGNTKNEDSDNGNSGSSGSGTGKDPDKEGAGGADKDTDSSDGSISDADGNGSDSGNGTNGNGGSSGSGNNSRLPGAENSGNPVSGSGNRNTDQKTDAGGTGAGMTAPAAGKQPDAGNRQELSGQIQDKTRGTLRIVNAAAGTGRKLDGAVFAVYDSAGSEIKRLTVQGGEALFVLPAGDYSLLELEAAPGYQAETAQISFKIMEGQETIVEVTNISGLLNTDPQKLIAKTGGSTMAFWQLLAALCFASAVGCSIGFRRLKKKS